MVGTDGSGSGFPGSGVGRVTARTARGQGPSSSASLARPREHRDFTVPTAQSSITATSATG